MKEVFEILRDSIAPARCMGCLREERWLCSDCRAYIPPVPSTCVVCKKIPEVRKLGGLCRSCATASGLSGIIGVGHYGSPLLRRGIHWLKFKGVTDVAADLSLMMLPKLLMVAPIQELKRSACLMPIPLHTSKLRQRGFNQSEILADALSRWTDIPVGTHLKRQRRTWSQAKLPEGLREKNMVGAFKLDSKLDENWKRILLLDDVTTSGTTLTEAARAVRTENRQVWGVVLARR